MALLDVISELAQVELSQLIVFIEPMLAESELRETTHHISLTAFETTSNGASRPRILTLMSLACSLSKAATWPSSDSFSLFAGARVVPEVIGGEGEQGLRANLLLH